MRASRLMAHVLGAALAAHAVAAPAAAQGRPSDAPGERRWVQDRGGDFPVARRLVVRTRGDLVVTGAPRADARYGAKLWTRSASREVARINSNFERVRFEAETAADGTSSLSLLVADCDGCRIAARLEVEVPEDLEVIELYTSGGDVAVRGVAAAVKARAAGGSISMDRIGADVDASATGRVTLGEIGGSVVCESELGRIQLERSGGSARLAAEVGSVRAVAVAGDLDARTGVGSIDIGRVGGTLRAETSSGSIWIAEAVNGVTAHIGAGDVRIARAAGALEVTSGTGNIAVGVAEAALLRDSVLSTAVGSIVISLPDTLALTVQAAVDMFTGGQSIISEFPDVRMRRPQGRLGRAQAAGAINGGGTLLRFGTRLGRIEIRKQRRGARPVAARGSSR